MNEPQITIIRPTGGIKLPQFNFKLPKVKPVVIIVATVILAVISVITALFLYQNRDKPVAPTAPASRPKADEPVPTPTPVGSLCTVGFTVLTSPSPTPTTSPEPTPTPTAEPTPTPTPTPTPGAPNNCNGTCGSNANCQSDLFCFDTGVQKYCRNPLNPTSTTCASLPGPTPTPTPTGIPGPTPTPKTITSGPTSTPVTLEEAGSVSGTWVVSLAGGALLLLGSILMFAL